jgi:hypothetical protein
MMAPPPTPVRPLNDPPATPVRAEWSARAPGCRNLATVGGSISYVGSEVVQVIERVIGMCLG